MWWPGIDFLVNHWQQTKLLVLLPVIFLNSFTR